MKRRILFIGLGFVATLSLVLSLPHWPFSVAMAQDANTAEPAPPENSPASSDNTESAVPPPSDPNQAGTGNAAEQQTPAEPEPGGRFRRDRDRRRSPEGDREEPSDPMDRMERVNFKDMEVKNLVDKIAEWTGKVVIPHPDAMKEKITIVFNEELPRRQVLQIIYAALKTKGFVVEEDGAILYLKPSSEAKIKTIPTIPPEQSLATLSDMNERVQRFVHVESVPPSELLSIIKPMMDSSNTFISANDPAHLLIMVDTVGNLIRFEHIIEQLDVPEADAMVVEIIPIQYADPVEIVQMIQLLMGNEMTRPSEGRSQRFSDPYSSYGRFSQRGGRSRSQPTDQRGSSLGRGASNQPMVLIPDSKRKQITARASHADMEIIREWVARLDRSEPISTEYETVPIEFVDVEELAEELDTSLQQTSGATELRFNVVIRPLPEARQIMIFGSKEKREMVKKIIAEIDIPPQHFLTRQFKLEFADADTIKQNLEELYELIDTSGMYDWYRMQAQMDTKNDPDRVRVISYPTRKQVTVIASPANMEKIAEQIKEWDVPLNVDDVKPLIVTLKNSDPVQFADLLNALFAESESDTSNIFRRIFGGLGEEDRRKIVGPLYGQLTFEAVPGTKKIIVISKIPAAYEVIRELILDLDGQEDAEVPMVVTLKYADAEDLCDQLNALLNEPGTNATLRRSNRGLSMQVDTSGTETQTSNNNQNNQNNQNNNNNNNPDIITPWWTQARPATDEMPTSNLIGRIRFVPVHRSKAVLVLSPPGFQDQIRSMIEQLDQPGKQVMLKAVIMQVDYNKLNSVGIQYATNPAALGDLNENAVAGLTKLLYSESPSSSFAVSSSLDVTVLIDLLIRETEGRIIDESTIWTKDNEESISFKGQRVPFVQASNTSSEGTQTRDQVEYRNVGLTLRIRPNITPENDVDLTVNLSISQLEELQIRGNIVTSNFDTTTHLIVDDGQTLMISGILEQDDSATERKVPLLGDIPLLGGLFHHESNQLANRKLLAFVTPYVVDTARVENEALERQDTIRGELDKVREQMEKKFLEADVAG